MAMLAWVLATTAAATLSAAVTTAEQRDEIALTIYNQNFGLVREVRSIDLGKGRVSLEFADVASTIQPETVAIRGRSGADALSVLEQNYLYDLLDPAKLLEKYVGRDVTVYRWNERTGHDEAQPARVLATNGGVILKIGDEITFGYPGRIAFPEIPDDLIARPTLRWLLESRRERQTVEVSYLARQLSWQADYVMVLGDAGDKASLQGWVTLSNQSGASYENARLKLVAGDVQRVTTEHDLKGLASRMRAVEEAGVGGFQQEGLFEYHLYTLGRPTTLRDREQKQVSLLEASDAGVKKRLIFRGQPRWYRSHLPEPMRRQKVGVFLDVDNRAENGLGMPLPKGTVRVYQADSSGALQFVGEDRIDHTPRNETVQVRTGDAFDVVADRRQTDFRVLSSCLSESAWEIQLRNHKDRAETVEVLERASGDWRILQSTHAAKKEDAESFRFVVPVPADGEVEIGYRVRVRWC